MQKKPVIWFVDDLHWANQSTVEIMTQIFEQHRAGYFMMIGTFRVNKDSAEEENQQRTSSFRAVIISIYPCFRNNMFNNGWRRLSMQSLIPYR